MTPAPDPTTLQAELQQRVPFPSPAQEAFVGVAKTASITNRAAGHLMAPRGLSLAQYNVLRILRGAEPTGLATLAIRDRMIDPAAAITRLIDKLEGAGLVERHRGREDRRQVNCRITAAGLTLLEELDVPVASLAEQVGTHLSQEELRQLNALLAKMRAGLR